MPAKSPAFVSILCINALLLVATSLFPSALQLIAINSGDFLTPLTCITGLAHLITYQFAHANYDHFFGNMFFLAPFAIYLERRFGSAKFVVFYLVCGVGSAVMFLYMPHSAPTGGLVGASGSISGVTAAAILLFGRSHKVLRAICILGLLAFILPQMVGGIGETLGMTNIAYWGHVGGMLTALSYLASTKDV